MGENLTQTPDILIILSGALTPIIVVITTYIAYQQHKTGKDKLRLDLYEKRFKVFNSLMQFMGVIVRDAKIDIKDISSFLASSNESRFLFEKGITEYLDEVYKKALILRKTSLKVDSDKLPIGEERNKLADEESKLLEWFTQQFEVSREKFFPYLYFKK